MGQNAPITTAPVLTACPGSVVSVPITVTGFNYIGSISLTLNYNASVLTFSSSSNPTGIPGLSVGHGTPGKITIGEFNSSGLTYPDNTVLCTINFNYLGGTSDLTWFDNGSSCQWATGPPNFSTLNDLPTSTYYINGQVATMLTVDFAASNLYPETNQTVQLTDLTAGGPTSWNWSINPPTVNFVNGTSAASQNPQVQFTAYGSYDISLTATLKSCPLTKTKTGYIQCVPKGHWTGITSADWNIPSNWSNFSVPDGTTDVVIPATSQNWPVYSGNLSIGSQCHSLTIDPASRMTVTGDLVIYSSK